MSSSYLLLKYLQNHLFCGRISVDRGRIRWISNSRFLVNLFAHPVRSSVFHVSVHKRRDKWSFPVEIWVLSVVVSQLDSHQVLHLKVWKLIINVIRGVNGYWNYHNVCWRKPLSQQRCHNIDNLFVQFREAEHFLLDFCSTVLNDPLHLFVNQFYAAQRWIF